MCDDHSGVTVRVLVPADLAFEGVDTYKDKGIDACIAPLVAALNLCGMTTVASCCGHGNRPGDIILADGREIIIAPDYDTARVVERAFPLTAYGEPVGGRDE